MTEGATPRNQRWRPWPANLWNMPCVAERDDALKAKCLIETPNCLARSDRNFTSRSCSLQARMISLNGSTMSEHPAGLASMVLKRTRIGNQVNRNDRAILWATRFFPRSVYAVRMVNIKERSDWIFMIDRTSFDGDANAKKKPEGGNQSYHDASLCSVAQHLR